MATAAAAPPVHPLALSLSPGRRALITVAVMLGTLMQVLDTTIANVALPHMQTSLGATSETVSWVLTSYIVASAIAIPITGWLADRIGRKPLFVSAVLVFTAASMLCAIATSLPEMVLFRVFQGISGAFVPPLAQAVMLDINTPERHARAMSVYGAGVVIGPILGPVLGGWLTDSFDWRWVFIVNLPVGIICTLMLLRFLPSTPRSARRFDLFGFALLGLALGGLQMMLDRGEHRSWFESWEIWLELGIAISAGWMFVVHSFTARDPLFDLKMFRDRNFTTSLIVMGVVGFLMMAGLALLPPLLQQLMGYSVLQSGMLTAPRGIGTLISMTIAGRLLGRVDARLLIFAGMLLMAFSLWQMAGFSLDMGSRLVVVSGFIQGLGAGLIFIPMNVLAFATLAPHFRTSGAALVNLMRNLGGSVGISMVVALLARNLQISHSDLASHITPESTPPLDPSVLGVLGDSGSRVMAMLDAEINRQAAMIAYIDDFHLMMLITLACLPFVMLFRRPRRPSAPAAE